MKYHLNKMTYWDVPNIFLFKDWDLTQNVKQF